MNSAKTFSILCLTIALGMTFSGCGKPKGGPGGMPPGGFKVNVIAAKAVVEPIEEKIALVGTLAPNESIDIKSQISGTVEEIGFDEGQQVHEGDVLLRIDERKLKASLDEAQARMDLAETTVQRLQGLVDTRAISQQEYDEAKANLSTSRAQMALIKEQLDDAVIKAPFDGVMGNRMVSVGQYIATGASLTSLISLNPVKAEFTVPERYIRQIHEGQTIEVQVTAYPDETFKGDVYFIDPRVDELTRTVLMKAKISNRDHRLKPGMFASLNLIISTKEKAIVIPETAVIAKDDNTSVFVVSGDNKASMRPIKIGIRLAGRVEVLEGISDGDVVVTEGFQKLREGADVNVKFEENSSVK